MSNFLNKIPVSPITSFGNPSVPNGSTIGTNFSILQTGGFMEVYSLSGLTYTIPPATTGIIEFSGNSIPIQFTKGSGSVFSPDVLTLNSDNISSGRRKLGMLAYVYETNKIYQFRIDNYDTLWGNATGATGPGGPTVVISNFGTTVKNNTPEGQSFINAWTASTISGIGGYDDTNASWRVLSTGGGTSITGGTFDNTTETLTLNNSTGGTITITGFTDYYVTGGTYANDSITFTNNSGGTFNVTGITTSSAFTGGTVTGATNFTNGLTANTISATTYQNLPTDIRVTGGTYSDGTTTFTNNTGGTFTVSGYFTGQTDNSITGGTFNNNTDTLTLNNSTGGTVTITGFTDYYTTGFTFNPANYDLTIQRNDGLPDLSVNLSILSSDVTITGGTYNSSTGTATFTNNTGGTFNVTGFLTGFTDIYVTGGTFNNNNQTLTLTRTDNVNVNVSGFTDVFVTGGTYTSGNAIFTNNTGGTFTVSGFNVGGGGGQVFYLNLSQSQNGNRLLSTTASTASEQTSGVTIANGVTSTIASFQSQPLNITLLPGGIWSFYLHSYKEDSNATFNIFVEVYKRTSGGTETLLFATDPAPVTTNSPNPSMQLSDGYFSGTSLNVSDSVVAVVRATNTDNQSHIITLVTEGSTHYSYVVSTIPTQQGLTCDTLSGCSIIQTIQTDISNKFDKSGGTVNGDLTVTGNTSLQGVTATTISASTVSATTISGGTMVITTTPTTDNTNTQLLSRDPSTGTMEIVESSSLPFNYGLSYTMLTGNYMI